MKLAATVVCIASVAVAVDFRNWHPAVDGDARSPCPAL
jgi:hypothetical protein